MADWWENQCGLDPLSGMSGDLVAHWKFDEGTGQAVSNAVAASYTGVVCGGTANWGNGSSGRAGDHALRFDGIDDYAGVSTNGCGSIVTQAPFSVSAWVYEDAATHRFGSVISDSGWSAPYITGYLLRLDTNAGAICSFAGAGYGCYRYDWAENFTGRGVHVVGTCDGTNQQLYVDGALAQTSAAAFRAVNNPMLSIGKSHVNDGVSYWRGAIDDVRICRKALSSREVAGMYDAWDDPDGDGRVNVAEFKAGKDPGNPD